MKEDRKRNLVKTISWRISATLITILIVYIFTRNLNISLGIGAVEIVSKFILYYGHERIWNLIKWGKK